MKLRRDVSDYLRNILKIKREERLKKITTSDEIELEVSEVKPIPYDSIMRNMIKKEVGNLKLVDRDKIESNTYF